MRSAQIFPAAALLGASAVFAQSTCTEDVRITEPTPIISCRVVDADIIIDEDVAGSIQIDGPEEIRGDFTARNASQVIGISSSTIESIEGIFTLEDMNLLSTLSMPALRELNEISFTRIDQLGQFTFGSSGLTSARSVSIVDTFISDLSGLNLATVDVFRIVGNRELTTFNSDLVNITESLIISENGENMDIEMHQLEMVSQVEVSGVSAFEVPSLRVVEQSLQIRNNTNLESFMADNITEIGESLTFHTNGALTRVSFEGLETIGGDMTIQQNPELTNLTGFPELTTIRGALSLAGAFESAELPSLNVIRGTAEIESTTDIEDFCAYFDSIEGDIQGDLDCRSEAEDALEEGGDSGDSGDSDSGDSDSGDDEDDEDAAAGLAVNMAMFGIAAVAGLALL